MHFFGSFLLQAVLQRTKCDIFRECVFLLALYHSYDGHLICSFFFEDVLPLIYFRKAIRLCRDVLMFHVSMSDLMSLVIDV